MRGGCTSHAGQTGRKREKNRVVGGAVTKKPEMHGVSFAGLGRAGSGH